MPQRYKVWNGAYPHFVTATITHWLPIFSRDDYFRILVDSLSYCVESKGLLVHGYVLMPNHFHAVLSQVEGRLPNIMRDIKGYTSRQIADKLESDGRILWLNALRNADPGRSVPFLRQKLDYMHSNPVRSGYVEEICHWKYSSAAFYYQDRPSLVPITPLEG